MGGTLSLLFGAVALLLLIGCGYVLDSSTGAGHRPTARVAVRSAIGAGRNRIVWQLLTESLLLSLTGAGIALVLAYNILHAIVENLPELSFPHEAAIQSIYRC